VSAPAISLAFFDVVHEIHGALRSGLTLLWEAGTARALPEAATIEPEGDGYRARLEDHFDLRFEPSTGALAFPGSETSVCRVSGTALGRDVECLGTATETARPLGWENLDAVRSVSAVFEPDRAVLALARRPRGARGHGEELVNAHLLDGEEILAVEHARLSTLYDGEGRHRSAGLELWLPGLDFPRRASGTVRAGASIALEGLRVNAAVFSWSMEGRQGVGAYDVTLRDEPAAA